MNFHRLFAVIFARHDHVRDREFANHRVHGVSRRPGSVAKCDTLARMVNECGGGGGGGGEPTLRHRELAPEMLRIHSGV